MSPGGKNRDGKMSEWEYRALLILVGIYGKSDTVRNSGSFKVFENIRAISFTSCDVPHPLRGLLGRLAGQ
jgi:hypothetical protein